MSSHIVKLLLFTQLCNGAHLPRYPFMDDGLQVPKLATVAIAEG